MKKGQTLTLTDQPGGGGVRMPVKAVPGASRDGIAGVLGGALKVAVTASPEGGKANRAIVELIATRLGLHASQVQITRGHTGPRKDVLINGLSSEQIRQRLEIV